MLSPLTWPRHACPVKNTFVHFDDSPAPRLRKSRSDSHLTHEDHARSTECAGSSTSTSLLLRNPSSCSLASSESASACSSQCAGSSASTSSPLRRSTSGCSLASSENDRFSNFDEAAADAATQLVFGNLVGKLADIDRDSLALCLHEEGFDVDFVYRPCKFKTKKALEFAFVNFVSSEEALRAYEHFKSGRAKPSLLDGVKVYWRKMKGGGYVHNLQECMSRYSAHSRPMHEKEDYRPAFFQKGRRVERVQVSLFKLIPPTF